MKNRVSWRKLITTPTIIGITWTSSSNRMAGRSRRYGSPPRRSRPGMRGSFLPAPPAPVFSLPASCALGDVTVAVMESASLRHLLLGLGQFFLDPRGVDLLASGHVGPEVLHRRADGGLE